ncbi:MAG: single-stranded-DNA-specific exonuclease RecJ [Chloroflexi bacterium]|nr:single-stranded-DNA-specific exonuclease RecJ [Chloroflexota bacterium]
MKWIEPKTYRPSAEIQDAFPNSLLLAGQLTRRGISTLTQARQFLEISSYQPSSPFDFPDLERAVARISKAISTNELIGIWGDFDVDGQTSTALLVAGLRALGARVAYHVPVRAEESHGIGLDFLKSFLKEGIQLLITCDTGISEFESLEFLRDLGLDVILTDHHMPGGDLPPALSILNPRLLPSGHPMSDLAGVGTAFQVIRGLIEGSKSKDSLDQNFHDLVALGTIADLAELTGENRYYAKLGLEQLNQNLRLSIKAILEFAGFTRQRITESHISFTFAPRMNSIGRLADANPMVDFLISSDEDFIRTTAIQMEELNARRKIAVEMIYRSALDLLDQQPALLQYPVILLGKSGWEGGVVGIVASRMVEKFSKPAILMNIKRDVAAGSARSVEGIDIIQAIQSNAGQLIRFGGHPMAAGLSMQVDQIPQFREALSASIDSQLLGKAIEPQLEIDAYLPFTNLSPALLDEIDLLAPFGPGNQPPLLVSRGVEIEKNTSIGKSKEHLRLTLKDQQGGQVDALWWNSASEPLPDGLLDIAYYARRDTFNGAQGVILEWVDYHESARRAIEIRPTASRYRILDHRFESNLTGILDHYASVQEALIWAEGSRVSHIQALTREKLQPSHKLVILTPPPSMTVMIQALKLVSPAEVILCAMNSVDDSLQGFLSDIAQIVKKEMANGQTGISLLHLAGVLGQTIETVHAGLKWWQLRGELEFSKTDDLVSIKSSKSKPSPGIQPHTLDLQELLKETAAFRSYYRRADSAVLFD